MKSLIYQGATAYTLPATCSLRNRRTEVTWSAQVGDRKYTTVVRDKIAPEDTVVMGAKALAFAIMTNEPYAAKPVPRAIKDVFCKDNVVI